MTTSTLGKYEIIEALGKGAFAQVYKAKDPSLQRVVALKVLHAELASDAEFVTGFVREAQTAANLSGSHLAHIYEVGEAQGRYFIAMQYLSGGTLVQRLAAGKRPSLQQAVDVIAQVAEALDTVHQAGLVHRDIKPSNILFDEKGQAYLSDFGIARAAENSTTLTASRRNATGTAAYLSPELAKGEKIDRRSDIYTLGVVAYEMLAGRPPFQSENLYGYIRQHADAPPPPLAQFNPQIPQAVQNAILKALEKDPNQRYASAGEFAQALRKALVAPVIPASAQAPAKTPASTPMQTRQARPTPAPRTLPNQKPRRSGLAIGLAILGLIGACALIVAGIFALKGPDLLAQIADATPVSQAPAASPTPRILPATSTSAPLVQPSPLPSPTATRTPVPTIAQPTTESQSSPPTPNPTPSFTPTFTHTFPPPPTATPTTAPGEMTPLVGTGVSIETLSGSGVAGQGQLIVRMLNGMGQPINGQYLRVYSQKQDLAGQWVVDDELASRYTDNTGQAIFDLEPGSYIVRSDFIGYNWGTASDVEGQANIPVQANNTTQLTISLGRLAAGFLRADNTVYDGQYVRVYTQKKDLAGRWVVDEEVASGYTDNTGIASFNLTPGYYIIRSNFSGYNWGDATDVMGVTNVALSPGQETTITLHMGQIVVGLTNESGQPIESQYVRIYTQKQDVTGAASIDEEVSSGYTDNAGLVTFNLTPGSYAVRISDVYLYNVTVETGRITFTDGKTFEVR